MGLAALGTAAFFIAADFAVPTSRPDDAVSGVLTRDFFLSGFICLATLSHKTRSSSDKARPWRCDDRNSGIRNRGGRFMVRVGGDGSGRLDARRGQA